MIKIRNYQLKNETADINISPLIDMVFILLIFFVVTSSFIREPGVAVKKPTAVTADPSEKETIIIAVTDNGMLYMDNRQIDMFDVRGLVRSLLRQSPARSVVIAADANARTGLVVQVIDECTRAGAENIRIAAEHK